MQSDNLLKESKIDNLLGTKAMLMKKILIITLLSLPGILCHAQKGFELKLGGGLEFIGTDPWLNGGIMTGSVLYNINGVVAIAASYSQGINNTFYIEAKSNAYKSSVSELGLDVQVTFLRVGKVKIYGSGGVGQVKVKNKEPVPDFINNDPLGTPTLELEDSAVGFGLGFGGVLNLGGGLYLNFLEYRFRTLGSDFMEMDKGFHGSVGPMHTFKAGISYVFGAK